MLKRFGLFRNLKISSKIIICSLLCLISGILAFSIIVTEETESRLLTLEEEFENRVTYALGQSVGEVLDFGNYGNLESWVIPWLKTFEGVSYFFVELPDGEIAAGLDESFLGSQFSLFQNQNEQKRTLSAKKDMFLDKISGESHVYYLYDIEGKNGENISEIFLPIYRTNSELLGSIRIGFFRSHIHQASYSVKSQILLIGILLIIVMILVLYKICSINFKPFQQLSEIFKSEVSLVDKKKKFRDVKANSFDTRQIKSAALEYLKNIEHESDLQNKINALEKISIAAQAIAHDLKKPFLSAEMISAMILDKSGLDIDQLKKVTRELLVNKKGALIQLNNLVNLGQRIEPEMQNISLVNLLDSYKEYFNIGIDFQYGHTMKAYTDEIILDYAIYNLLENAVQAARHASDRIAKVCLKTIQHSADQIVIRIENNGKYISDENKSKIFKPFFTAGKRRGSGLGLYNVNAYANSIGGKIACVSSGIEGTVFELSILSSLETDVQSKLVSYSTMKSLNIFVLDDDKVYLSYFIKLISGLFRHNIEFASDIDSARACLTKNKFDLIFLDIELEDNLDGLELLAELRNNSLNRSTSICMHSNLINLRQQSLSKGADFFLNKPASKEQLEKLLLRADRLCLEN